MRLPVLVLVSRWLAAVVACLLVAALLGYLKFSEIQGVLAAVAAQPEYSETVETATPVPTDFQPRLEALGVVVAPLQVTLRSEMAGYITTVGAPAGARVSRGQVLLQLDLSEQAASLAAARARLALASAVLKRDLDLQKSSFVSEDKVDRSRAEVAVVEAEIAGIESVINRRTIRAPFDGVIGIHRFEVGQYLDNNSVITTLVGDRGEMWVDFAVPQFYGELAAGHRVSLRIVRSAGLDGEALLAAEVIAGDASIDAASRSRRYRAVVREGSERLLDNMSVSVHIPLGLATPLLAVPSLALQSDIEGEFVWLLDRDSGGQGYRARRQAVTSFGQQGELTFVDSLRADQLIAAAGAFKLSPGLLVKTTAALGEAREAGAE
jgi:membrane fusion protein (multidrug efflux system)